MKIWSDLTEIFYLGRIPRDYELGPVRTILGESELYDNELPLLVIASDQLNVSSPDMYHYLRSVAKRSNARTTFRIALDAAGIFCACSLVWENVITIQLSEGPSMYPTFNPRGDYLLISRVHKRGRGIEVGDVVRFYHPTFLGVNGAKRVLGMPGDFVCKDPPFSTSVGETQEMIQVCAKKEFVAQQGPVN